MERATGLVVAPGFLQGNITIDNIDDVNTGQQVINKLLGYQSGHDQYSNGPV